MKPARWRRADAVAVAPTSAGHGGRRPPSRPPVVSVGYGDRLALADVDPDVRRPARSWRSSGRTAPARARCSRLIAGLLKPLSGTVEVLGGPPGREARRIAYVPQAEAVDWEFPVTVGDVVMMGRVPAHRPRPVARGRDDRARRRRCARQGRHARRRSSARSAPCPGGQRRRVFLARAIAAEPDLYLLDEPVTGVDATTQEDLMDILEGEARGGRTVIATTHDLACAAQRFHQAAFVNGRIVATGPGRPGPGPDAAGGDIRRPRARPAGGRPHVLDDAHHHDRRRPANATSTTGRADVLDFIARPDGLRLHAARPRRGDPGRGRLRGHGRVRRPAGPRVHRRRGQPRGVPRAGHRLPARGPAVHRRRRSPRSARRSRSGAVARRGALRFDTAVGVLFAGTFAFGILLFSTIKSYVADLFGYLLGNVLGHHLRGHRPDRHPRR